jgi:hypothetical protein
VPVKKILLELAVELGKIWRPGPSSVHACLSWRRQGPQQYKQHLHSPGRSITSTLQPLLSVGIQIFAGWKSNHLHTS